MTRGKRESSETRRRTQRGSTFVEGALLLMVLLLMTTAILDFGQLMLFLQAFNERARAGARYAAVNSYDAATIKNIVVYNKTAAPDGVTYGLFGLKPDHVEVNRYNSGELTDRIEIKISKFPMRFYSPFIAGSYSARPWRVVIAAEGMGATN